MTSVTALLSTAHPMRKQHFPPHNPVFLATNSWDQTQHLSQAWPIRTLAPKSHQFARTELASG